jgi:hypothetical protein
MLRKLAVAALAAIGIAALAPGAASADPYPNIDDFCTQTGTVSWFEWDVDNSHNPPLLRIVGTHRASYVNTTPGLLNTLRVWHVTYQPNGGSAGYEGAFAAKCSSGTYGGELNLTKQPPPLSSFDQRCGTTDFTNGSTSYHYLGARVSSGDTFRYWGTTFSTPMAFGLSATAARCD